MQSRVRLQGADLSMSSLAKRVISACVMLPLVLAAMWYGGWGFLIFIFVLTVAAVFEWGRMALSGDKKAKDFVILSAGYLYILFAASAMIFLRLKNENGFALTLLVFGMIWATDICAYFSGKTIGGPKMAPKISPNKTWAGMIGGMLGSAGVAALFTLDAYRPAALDDWSLLCMLILGACFAVIGQAGDLLVSAMKRKYGVKDTGHLIPGHGGVLDRIDALLLAAPVFSAILIFGG